MPLRSQLAPSSMAAMKPTMNDVPTKKIMQTRNSASINRNDTRGGPAVCGSPVVLSPPVAAAAPASADTAASSTDAVPSGSGVAARVAATCWRFPAIKHQSP